MTELNPSKKSKTAKENESVEQKMNLINLTKGAN